jgi:hypothetical protein
MTEEKIQILREQRTLIKNFNQKYVKDSQKKNGIYRSIYIS